MSKFILLLSAAFIAGQASAADIDQRSTAPLNYTVNIDSRGALEWHALAKPISRGLVVDILVNGKEIKAAIDSGNHGAGLLQLRSSAAARLGLTPTGPQVSAQTYGGVTTATTGVANSVIIGGVSFSDAPVRIENRWGFDDDIEAVIGADLLQFVTLVIDPGNRRVRFLLPGELADVNTGGSMVPLKDGLHWKTSSVEVRFCGDKADMVLDTGSNADLNLRTTLLRRTGCRSSVMSDVRSETDGGVIFALRSGITDAAMGGIALGPVLAQGIPDSLADALGIDGGIGLGVLSRFVTAIDISSRRMAILAASPESAGIERPTIGLQVRRTRNALEVLHVEGGSPASRSPLKTGDKICAVDGEAIATLGDHFNTNPPPGTELKLETCDGRAVSITASDFLFPAGIGQPAQNDFAITHVGDFTIAVNDCVWGDDKGKSASCTKVINAPAETRTVGDLRLPAYLYRAQGEVAVGDTRRALEDYRRVLVLDPNNARAKAALGRAGS